MRSMLRSLLYLVLFPVLLVVLLPALLLGQSNVSGTRFVSTTPVTDTAIYAAGDLIGGKLTFFPTCRGPVNTGYITHVRVADKAATDVDLELVLWYSDPSATTFTDQAAFDPADADLATMLAVIPLDGDNSAQWADNGTYSVNNLMIPIRCGANVVSRTLYGALVSRGTPTYASSSDITITLGVLLD